MARILIRQIEPIGEFILSKLVALIFSSRVIKTGIMIIPDTNYEIRA
jgi:hypothetical protein